MPVTWEIRNLILVITIAGYAGEEPRAVSRAWWRHTWSSRGMQLEIFQDMDEVERWLSNTAGQDQLVTE
jgi:hypothetical protein